MKSLKNYELINNIHVKKKNLTKYTQNKYDFDILI